MRNEHNLADWHLIKQLVDGDRSAFTRIYNLHCAKVYKLAFRFVKNKEQSEEIVQETFIKLWLNRSKLDPEGNLWLYVYVIAKRTSLNALREICKSKELTENLLTNIDNVCNVTEEYINGSDLERFTEKIISRLPPQQKLIFRLSRVDGLSHKEIAEQLNISPNTVKNHMVEALKTVRSHLRVTNLISIIMLTILK